MPAPRKNSIRIIRLPGETKSEQRLRHEKATIFGAGVQGQRSHSQREEVAFRNFKARVAIQRMKKRKLKRK